MKRITVILLFMLPLFIVGQDLNNPSTLGQRNRNQKFPKGLQVEDTTLLKGAVWLPGFTHGGDSVLTVTGGFLQLVPVGGGATGYIAGDNITISGDTIAATVPYRLNSIVNFNPFTGHAQTSAFYNQVVRIGFYDAELFTFSYPTIVSGYAYNSTGLLYNGFTYAPKIEGYSIGNLRLILQTSDRWQRSDTTSFVVNQLLMKRDTLPSTEFNDHLTLRTRHYRSNTLKRSQYFTATDNGVAIGDSASIISEIIIDTAAIYVRPNGYGTTTDKYLRGEANGSVVWQHFTYASMDSTARNALTPATGMAIFCTDCPASDASTGVVQVYNGTAWRRIW